MTPRKLHDFIEDLRIRIGGAKQDGELGLVESMSRKLDRLMCELEFISFNGKTRAQAQARIDRNQRERNRRARLKLGRQTL